MTLNDENIVIDRNIKSPVYNAEKSSHGTLECINIANCSTSRARVNRIILKGKCRDAPQVVDTPIFMPVGTQGAMKGITTEQMKDMNCQLFLGNTYHLGHRPGPEVMKKAGGLHKFMKWDNGLLTDSGGFQMVSLAKLSFVTEEGVNFTSPHDESQMLLTPEHSMEIQNAIGADIMMQLDDVISSLTVGPRVEQAMYRSVRWLDRCIEAHARPQDQALFAIVQGGLDGDLRQKCLEMMVARKDMVGGYAIGGLSGGEEKDLFWRAVDVCCRPEGGLPADRPRYVMGVGYSLDLIVCVALGADMFDCVFPTRTGRFGCALVPTGSVYLPHAQYRDDERPIDEDCACAACRNHSRAYLHSICGSGAFASLVSLHNVAYMLQLTAGIRAAVLEDRFPAFCRAFFARQYADESEHPRWAVEALASVGIVI